MSDKQLEFLSCEIGRALELPPQQCCKAAVAVMDCMLGTPCEQIRHAQEKEELEEQLTEAREALQRLSSMEAFTVSRPVTDHPADKELIARMFFAEEALAKLSD